MSDSAKINYLGKILLRLETRSSDGSLRKLFLVNLSFLFPAILTSGLMYMQKVSAFEFSFINFLLFSLLMIFSIINELDNILLSENECEIYSTVPLSCKILSGAKMYMLTRLVLLMAIPLYIPSGVFYFLLSNSIGLSFVYVINGYVAGYFIINIVVLLYAVAVRNFKISRSSNFRLLLQLIMILLLILGYQFISYGISARGSVSLLIDWLNENRLTDFLPSFWFAFSLSTEKYVQNFAYFMKITLPYLIFFFSYLSLRNYLMQNYPVIADNLKSGYIKRKTDYISESGISRLIYEYLVKIYLVKSKERASYRFMRSMLMRDKTLRSSVYLVMILPAGLAFFGLMTNQLPELFNQNYLQLKPVFHISILFSVMVVLNTALLGIRSSDTPEASWIYLAYPMYKITEFVSGIRKFFVLHFLLPIALSVLVITLFSLTAVQALVNVFFIFSSAMLYNALFFRFSRLLPFTEKNTTINSFKRIASIINPFIFSILIVMVQSFVYKDQYLALITAIIILFISILINLSCKYYPIRISQQLRGF